MLGSNIHIFLKTTFRYILHFFFWRRGKIIAADDLLFICELGLKAIQCSAETTVRGSGVLFFRWNVLGHSTPSKGISPVYHMKQNVHHGDKRTERVHGCVVLWTGVCDRLTRKSAYSLPIPTNLAFCFDSLLRRLSCVRARRRRARRACERRSDKNDIFKWMYSTANSAFNSRQQLSKFPPPHTWRWFSTLSRPKISKWSQQHAEVHSRQTNSVHHLDWSLGRRKFVLLVIMLCFSVGLFHTWLQDHIIQSACIPANWRAMF